MNLFVLPARKGMEKPGDGPWVAPIQGRVGHGGQWHVDVESRSEGPGDAADDCSPPFASFFPRLHGEVHRRADDPEAEEIKKNEQTRLIFEGGNIMRDR